MAPMRTFLILITLYQFLVLSRSSPQNCEAGTQRAVNSVNCIPCARNSASTTNGVCRNIGRQCPPGSGSLFRSGNITKCQECPVGTFCTTGQCLTTNPNDPTNGCNPCPSGLGADSLGAVQCTPDPSTIIKPLCPPGSGLESFLRGCYTCPSNSVNNGTLLSCRPCPTNLISSSDFTTCNLPLCEAGFYQVNTSSPCIRCPIGTSSPPGWINPLGCLPSTICGPGESPALILRLGTNASTTGGCIPCSLQSACRGGQCLRYDSTGVNVVQGCPLCIRPMRSTQLGSLRCTNRESVPPNCPPGSGVMVGMEGCYNCSINTINDGTSSTCTPCPPQRQSNWARTRCDRLLCPAGMAARGDTCVDCPPTFASSTNGNCRPLNVSCGPGQSVVYHPSGSVCEICPPNTACKLGRCIRSRQLISSTVSGCNVCTGLNRASLSGASLCTSSSSTICPPGTGQLIGSRGCYNCTATSFNNGSFSMCQPCPPNMISDPQTLSFCITRPCNPGFYRKTSSPSDPCQECAPYTASPWGLISPTGCIRTNVTSSILCGRGQVPIPIYYGNNMPIVTICSTCFPYRFCPNGRCMRSLTQYGCPNCVPGFTSTGEGNVLCTPSNLPVSDITGLSCPAGTGVSIGFYGCKNCTGNTFNSGIGPIRATCRPCGTNEVATSNNSMCVPVKRQCDAGTQLVNGICQSCPDGWASERGKSCTNVRITCSLVSSVLIKPGGAVCQTCPVGTFCPNAKCLTRDEGNPLRGCMPCKTDTASDASGATACTPMSPSVPFTGCPRGSGMYINSEYSLRGCYACNDTSYNNRDVARFCLPCRPNFISSASGTSCVRQPCQAGFYETANSCAECPAYSGSGVGATLCTKLGSFKGCLPGQFINTISVTPLRFMCEDCGSGSFCRNGRCLATLPRSVAIAVRSGCTPCSRDTIATGFGAVACQPLNNSTTRSARFLCPPGSGQRKAYTGCYRCSTTTYNNGSFSRCQKCPTNMVPSPDSTSCEPKCPAGSGFIHYDTTIDDFSVEARSLCQLCSAGDYNNGQYWNCRKCPTNTWSRSGASACRPCNYPYISLTIRQQYISCMDQGAPIQIGESNAQLYVSVGCMFISYILTLASVYFLGSNELTSIDLGYKSSEHPWSLLNLLGLIILTSVSFGDFVAKICYIGRQKLKNSSTLFALCFVLLGQLPFFINHLVRISARPRLVIPIPRFLFIFKSYQSFYRVLITAILCSPFILINLPFMLLWLLFGWFFYASKLMHVGKVERLYLYIWTGHDYSNIPFFGQHFYNAHDFTKLVFENFPQLIVQTLNSYLVDNFSVLYQISLAFSVLSIISGFYRLLHSHVFQTGNFLNAPINIKILNLELLRVQGLDADQSSNLYKYKYKVDDDGSTILNSITNTSSATSTTTAKLTSTSTSTSTKCVSMKGNEGYGVKAEDDVDDDVDDVGKVEWTESPLSTKG